MMRLGLACFTLLFPLVGWSCESVNREQCKQRFAQLVTYRTEAITNAFGDLVGTLPEALEVRFVGSKELAETDGKETYDAEHRTLVFPRRLLSAKLPNPMRAAATQNVPASTSAESYVFVRVSSCSPRWPTR